MINSPVTGSFIKLNTSPGFSLILKQMASSFCGTDIMKCGSPSTVKQITGVCLVIHRFKALHECLMLWQCS